MLIIEQGIEIIDKQGQSRIRIGIDESTSNSIPYFRMMDARGIPRITICLEGDSGKINIYDPDGNLVLGCGECDSDGGLDQGGGIILRAGNDSGANAFLVPVHGEFQLRITQRKGRIYDETGNILQTQEYVFPEERK